LAGTLTAEKKQTSVTDQNNQLHNWDKCKHYRTFSCRRENARRSVLL